MGESLGQRRGQRCWHGGVLLIIGGLVLTCGGMRAQDQQNQQPAQAVPQSQAPPSQSPQQQSPQEQSPQNQPPQNQPPQSQAPPSQPSSPDQAPQNQAPQNQAPQNQPPQNEPSSDTSKPDKPASDNDKKDDSSNPAEAVADKTKEVTVQAAEATKKLGEVTFTKVRDWENGYLTGPYISKNRERVTLTGEQRQRIYLQQTLTTPSAYFKRMFSAAVDQARDSPPQWPQGWEGYGDRFASREGQFIAANSLAALGNAALRYEPRYDQCKCSGFKLRTRHAILRNFVTYDQSEQTLRPQWALYGGAFGGGLISSTWKPHPRSPLRDAGFGMLGQAGYGALLNFFTEFAGDINRKLGARKH